MKKILSYILIATLLLFQAAAVAAEETVSVSLVSPTESSVIYEGEALSVKAAVTQAEDAYKVAFYLNGEKAAQVYSKSSVECEIIGASAGENLLKVEALTAAGQIMATDSVKVIVRENTAPVVTVSALDDENPEIILSETSTVSVSVTDEENNFAEATVFLNGEELITAADAEFDVDLSEAAAGENLLEISAVDACGKKAVYSKSFLVERQMQASLLQEDFESYSGGTPSGFTNFVTNKGAGYAAVTTEDESYGTSLELKTSAAEENADVDAHLYFGVTDGGTKPVYILKASYYFPGNEENEHDATATLYFRDKNGSNRELVDFDKNGKLKFYGNGGSGSAASGMAYDLDTWYDLELVIDTLTGEYSAYLNEEEIIAGKVNTYIRDIGISAFRYGICTRTKHVHSVSDIGARVYVDNLSIESILDLPTVEKVFSDGNNDGVDGGVSDISVKIDGVILGTDVKDNLTIESNLGKIDVKDASYDAASKTILISTDAIFQPNVSYTLTLQKGLKITDTMKTDGSIRYSFTVEEDDVDAENAEFFFNGGKINFKAEIVNNRTEAVLAMAIIYVWKGNEIVSAHCQNIDVPAGDSGEILVEGKPLVSGETATAYIFEMPDFENAITRKSYTYSN